MKFKDLKGKPFWNLFANFSSKMMLLNSNDFLRAWDQSLLGERTWKFPDISYFTDSRQMREAEKIPKTVLKTRLKTK
jgi:hypothetical protein